MPQRRTNRLAAIATRHQVFLERYKAGKIGDLVSVFAQIDKLTREIITTRVDSNMSELSKRKLDAMLVELQTANAEALEKGKAKLFEDLETLAAYEAGFELRTLQALVGAKVKEGKAAAAFAFAKRQPIGATGELLESFVENWSAGELARMNNLVRKAWGEGWTIQQMVTGIRGTKAQGYSDGILASSRRNAESIARTAIQHVASTGRMSTWEANSDLVQGYRYIATLDAKTTQICRSLDQKVFKLGEGPVPPMHIRCRSTTIAEMDPSLDFLDEGATRSSLDGPVAADMSYYEWLKGQDAEFVKEALGATRAKLFLEGGLSADEFARLNLSKNFHPLTLDEMRQLEPLAFKRAGIKEK